jgi:glutaredoxin 3
MNKRKVEIFSAGCPACKEVIQTVKAEACDSCDIEVLDMNNSDVSVRADNLGIRSVPAVVIDGKLADCCAGRGVNLDTLKEAGVGTSIQLPGSSS